VTDLVALLVAGSEMLGSSAEDNFVIGTAEAPSLVVVAQGTPGPTGPAGTAIAPYEFAYNEASPATVYVVPALALVSSIRIGVRTPFNGTGAALSVGIPGQPTLLMLTSDNDPTIAADYGVFTDIELPGGTPIQLYTTPGFGATQGAGVVLIDLVAQ